jgi:hypothetical protein
MKNYNLLFLCNCIITILISTAGCREKSPVTAADDYPYPDTSHSTVQIKWESTERKLSHDVYFAEYGRIRKIGHDSLMLTYHCGKKNEEWNNIVSRLSTDNGSTWQKARYLLQSQTQNFIGFCQPDLRLLNNGQLILVYCARGYRGDTAVNHIQYMLSKDKGNTWSKPADIASGHFWEPNLVQLPDDELEVFFTCENTNSKRSAGRPEQRIMLCSSLDKGATWAQPKEVDFKPRIRDGMPHALLLDDNKGIVFAIETVNDTRSPYIVWSSLAAKWQYKSDASEKNQRRWRAYPAPVWGGAPAMAQLPGGQTVLAVQTEGGRKIDRYKNWKKNTIVTFTGNTVAKNFSNLTYAYPNLPVNEGAYFCSLFLKDPRTLWLISSRNFADGHSEVYLKEGHIRL